MQDIKTLIVWIILIGLSLLMFALAQGGLEGKLFVVLILLAAWFKGQMIIDHFMGLRRVEVLWRMIVSVWLMLVLGIILIVYLWGG